MNRKVSFALALLLALSFTGAPGCGLWDSWFGSTSQNIQSFDTTAQVLANQAEGHYRDGEYNEAAELFQQLKDRYPYSKYALLADLRVGDAYFKSDRFEEAVLAYDDFIRLHPKNEAVPYAIYQIGMVNFSQMLDPSRDPTFAKKASETFQRLVRNHPKSKEAVRAGPKLQQALERLAAHDMFVGKYYYEADYYQAAIYRFKRVLTQYPDVGQYREALEYIKLAQKELADLTPEELRQVKEDRWDLERPLASDRLSDVLEDPTTGPGMGTP